MATKSSIRLSLRYFIDLVEKATSKDLRDWTVEMTDLCAQTAARMRKRVPDLSKRLARFAHIKLPNPLDRNAMFGKSDRPLTGPLAGFWHCHLSDDCLLIYRLHDRKIQLVLVCQHADIEGKRLDAMARMLAAY